MLEITHTVQVVPVPFEEYEEWMRQLNLVTDDGKLDWKRILKEADLGTSQQYVIKDRWGDNPKQMAALHDALKRIELNRKQHTVAGARMLAIEEWTVLGRLISRMPDVFQAQIDRIREVASAVLKHEEAERLKAEAAPTLASPFREPTKSRK